MQALVMNDLSLASDVLHVPTALADGPLTHLAGAEAEGVDRAAVRTCATKR